MGDNKIRLFLWDIQSRKMPEKMSAKRAVRNIARFPERSNVCPSDNEPVVRSSEPPGVVDSCRMETGESVVFSTKSLFFVKPSLNSWPGGAWKEPIL